MRLWVLSRFSEKGENGLCVCVFRSDLGKFKFAPSLFLLERAVLEQSSIVFENVDSMTEH